MKILAIDTSSQFLCLGAYDNGRLYEYNLKSGTKLSSLLAPALKRLTDALDWDIKDVDYLACGIGPGSFTGLRIGISAIKGISFALDKPIVAVPTLDILAKNAKSENNALVIPFTDAKRNLIYSCIYRIKNGSLKRLTPYMLIGVDDFIKKVKSLKLNADAVEILGDGVGLYKEKLICGIRGARILDKDYWYPKAHNIISLALEQIEDKRVSNSFNIKPIYLYPKDCQIRKQRIA